MYNLDIVIVCHGLEMYGGILEKESLGGSETAAIQVSELLAKLGQHVVLICNTKQPHIYNKVTYIPFGWVEGQNGLFPKGMFDYVRSTPFDVLMVMRQPQFFQFHVNSKVNILWQHDLATKTGPSNFHPQVWNIDKIFVLSEFMKKQYQQVHHSPDKLYHVTRNGIDYELIHSIEAGKRDKYKLTYTARPERGLDILLARVFPEILKREPNAKLYLSRYKDVNTLPLYEQLAQLRQQFGDKIVDLGNLNKKELYLHYKTCRLYLYPSSFEETSNLSSMELAVCGTPIIGSWKGALPETCKDIHPYLIKENGQLGEFGDPLDPGFKPVSEQYISKFVDSTIELMHDDIKWNKLSKVAKENSKKLGWDGVVQNWLELFHDIIKSKTENERSMFIHFISNSEIVGAKKYVEKAEDKTLKDKLDKYIENYFPFVNLKDRKEQEKAIAKFYEERSGGNNANWQTALFADREPRTQLLLEFIKQNENKIKSVLDFGMAHGGYVRAISNNFPNIKVTGVDVSESLVRCANELKVAKINNQNVCLYPDNMNFVVGNENVDLKEKFDAVLIFETIEHIPYSEDFLNKIERLCKEDGFMLFTVPYGTREREEFLIKEVPPVHVRSFDLHDIRDMVSHRKNFNVTAFTDMKESEYDKTISGWFMVTYSKDKSKVREIDWGRKLSLQAPRETVGFAIITHDAEDDLSRCMKSFQKWADQIVVIDNGPSRDSTVEIAKKFTNEIYSGTSPFYCYNHKTIHNEANIDANLCRMAGFETPRNESLERLWTQHCYWIDDDEVINYPEEMMRFLRPNIYLGYAINQHHLSTEPLGCIKTDLPVRLFRNNGKMKFYGKIHEHSEVSINGGVGDYCMVLPVTHIAHPAYLTEKIRKARFRRNLKLLECDRVQYPERTLGIYLYEIRDQMHMARYAWEANNRIVNQEVVSHCERVVNCFREKFINEDNMLTEDALRYYTDAMTLMGQGIEMTYMMDIKQQGSQLNNVQPIRFRCKDSKEAEILVNKKIRQLSQFYEGDYLR